MRWNLIRKCMYELSNLRTRLKGQGKRMQGRAPIVCSDNALYEMATLCLKKLSDFEGVAGIGRTFNRG